VAEALPVCGKAVTTLQTALAEVKLENDAASYPEHCWQTSALRARLLQAFGYSSLNKGLRIRPQRCCQSDWAGMVSASEVEEALKQRLEAKDVVGVRNTVQCINPMQYLRVVLRCRRLWTIQAGELL